MAPWSEGAKHKECPVKGYVKLVGRAGIAAESRTGEVRNLANDLIFSTIIGSVAPGRSRTIMAAGGKMVKLARVAVPTELLVSGRCQPGGNGVIHDISLRFLVLYRVRVYVSGVSRTPLSRPCAPRLAFSPQDWIATSPRNEFALRAKKVPSWHLTFG